MTPGTLRLPSVLLTAATLLVGCEFESITTIETERLGEPETIVWK